MLKFTSLKVPFILLVFTFFLLLTCGADSPLRIHYPHIDSSWFLMGGKAWMSGMVPYVDFTDSKGPLLWLIYGVGYLISPRSFYGVFWIGILFYWGTFWFLYRTARLLLGSESKALLAVFVGSVFFFIPGVHSEIRAEDYCQFFFAITFYTLVSTLIERRASLGMAFLAGLSLGGSLLIKYNIAGMLGVTDIFILIAAYRVTRRSRFLIFVSSALAGFLTLVLPFVVYFLVVGAFNSFITEYFVNTLLTMRAMQGTSGEWPVVHRFGFMQLLLSPGRYGLIFKIALALVAWLPIRIYRSNLLRLSIWISFVAVSLVVTSVVHVYYLNCLAIFCFFGVVTLCGYMGRVGLPASLMMGAVSIGCIVVAANSYIGLGEFSDPTSAKRLEAEYELIAEYMDKSRAEKGRTPTIAIVGGMDRGEHVKAGALPGTKYWARQNGSTSVMYERNREDVFEKLPDFVVAGRNDAELIGRLERAGYVRLMNYSLCGEAADSLKVNTLLFLPAAH